MVASAETVTMLMYSARKNSANFSEVYSVWKPPTSSPSASGQVERRAVGLADHRRRVDDERDRQRQRVPACAAGRATISEVDIVPDVDEDARRSDRPIAIS